MRPPAGQTALVFDIQRFSIHDGPGIRTCVFFKGCPMRCTWCSNPESQGRRPEPMWSRRDGRSVVVGERLTVDQVMAVAERDVDYYDHSGGGLTLSGGEFMLQPEFAARLIDAAHARGIPVVGETCGLAPAAVFDGLVARLDLVMMDLKHYDPARHLAATGTRLPLVLRNAEHLAASGTWHLFRIPVVPGVNDASDDAEAFGALLAGYGIADVELVPFHQYGKGKYADLGRDYAFAAARSLTSADLEEWQNVLKHHGVRTSLSG